MSRWKAILQAVTGGRSTQATARDERPPLVAAGAHYINGERSGSVRPAVFVSTGERVYLVNVGPRESGAEKQKLQVKDLDQAHQFAQEYVATGEFPDPDKSNSPRAEREGGPERSAYQTSSTYYQGGTFNPGTAQRFAVIDELRRDDGYDARMYEPGGASYEVNRPTRRGAEDVVEKFLDTGKMPQDRQLNPTDASLAAIHGAEAYEESMARAYGESPPDKSNSPHAERERGPEIEVKMTGGDRFEYRQGERVAVVEMKPDAAVRTITMGDASNPNAHSVERDTLRDAADAARDYVSTGKPPAPAPERTRSPRPERGGGPER